MASVMWFRRDLRLADQPALLAAADDGPVTALFVLDDQLRKPSGAPRLAFLYRTLRALDEDLRNHGGQLIVRRGRPERVLPAVVAETGADSVHVSSDHAPYGAARDVRVEQALAAGRDTARFVRTGSPYVVAPGRVAKDDGSPFKVYSAFYRRWVEHGWRAPANSDPSAVRWADPIRSDAVPADPHLPAALTLPDAGEAAAQAAWTSFRNKRLSNYDDARDRPDLDATSRLSPYLHFGSIHPRTLLHGLGKSADEERFRKELAWRDFYGAVLHYWPESAREYFIPEMAKMAYAEGATADAQFEAWQQGRTGFPIVDAGMRQLLAEGWVHNRVRMIVASFLVKDLHIEWTRGARHFMQHLVDADLASNQHGWQWTAGTGTDAAPYFRIFNPTLQGKKFDPEGEYIRRYVPELRSLSAKDIHEPGRAGAGQSAKSAKSGRSANDSPRPDGYPAPIVEHSAERDRSLANYKAVRDAS